MARNNFSPEYLKRRAELKEALTGMGRDGIVTRILHLQEEVRKSQANEHELRKIVNKYQGLFGRLAEILVASTHVSKSSNGKDRVSYNLPFSYENAFKNCRIIIADYYEDIKLCNPAGCVGKSYRNDRAGAERKIRRLRA